MCKVGSCRVCRIPAFVNQLFVTVPKTYKTHLFFRYRHSRPFTSFSYLEPISAHALDVRRYKLLALLIRHRRVRVHVALVPRGLGFGAGATSVGYSLSAHTAVRNEMFLVRGKRQGRTV